MILTEDLLSLDRLYDRLLEFSLQTVFDHDGSILKLNNRSIVISKSMNQPQERYKRSDLYP